MLLQGYTGFEAVDDLAQGGLALLPLEEDAEAFRYRKQLHIHVDLARFGSSLQQTLTGKWKIRLRESAAPNAAILFEQEVEWRALIIALVDPFFGSIGFVTWSPLDEGDGRFTTTVVDGSPVDPAEAWKYVDDNTPTEFSEEGATDHEPNGVATVGTYEFFATFYSPPYKCLVPPGAVLERVSDNWGIGFLDQNATYEFSFKNARAQVDATLDHFMGLLRATTEAGAATLALGYEPYLAPQRRAFVFGTRNASIGEDRHGRLWMVAREPGGWWEYLSSNGGHTFEPRRDAQGNRLGPLWPPEVVSVRPLMLDNGTALSVGLDGSTVLVKRRAEDEDTTIVAGRLKRKQAITPIERHGTLFIVGEDGVLFESKRGGAVWEPRHANAEAIAPPAP